MASRMEALATLCSAICSRDKDAMHTKHEKMEINAGTTTGTSTGVSTNASTKKLQLSTGKNTHTRAKANMGKGRTGKHSILWHEENTCQSESKGEGGNNDSEKRNEREIH